jgi:hypothetical protein
MMIASMQQLLDRVRAHNEECRQLAGAAADLASSRREIIAAFGELGIRQKKAGRELVKLAVTLTEVTGEAPDAAPAAVPLTDEDGWDIAPPPEPAAPLEPADPLAIPPELDRRKGTA